MSKLPEVFSEVPTDRQKVVKIIRSTSWASKAPSYFWGKLYFAIPHIDWPPDCFKFRFGEMVYKTVIINSREIRVPALNYKSVSKSFAAHKMPPPLKQVASIGGDNGIFMKKVLVIAQSIADEYKAETQEVRNAQA